MMNQRVVEAVDDGNQRTITNLERTSIAPKLVLKAANGYSEIQGSVRVHLEVNPETPALCFSFLNIDLAKAAMDKPRFLSCALWKALPMMEGDLIDEVVEGFIRSEDLYDSRRTFNKMADHHLREAGVFCISPVALH